MNTKVVLITLSLIVFATTSVVLGSDAIERGAAFAGAHKKLLADTQMPTLRAYLRCGLRASCRQRFSEKADTGEPFPMLLGLLWLGGGGGVLGGLLVRPKG